MVNKCHLYLQMPGWLQVILSVWELQLNATRLLRGTGEYLDHVFNFAD